MTKTYFSANLWDILKTVSLLLISAFISYWVLGWTKESSNVYIFYILSVIIISKITEGYRYGFTASFLGIIIVYNCFSLSGIQFLPSQTGYHLTLVGMFIIAVIISAAMANLKSHVKEAERREAKTVQLNEISRKLLSLNSGENIGGLALEYVYSLTGCSCIFYSKSPQQGEEGLIRSLDTKHTNIMNSSHEQFVAHWVFENKTIAGFQTDFGNESSCTYLPLISHERILGVIGIFQLGQKPLSNSTLDYLRLIISQAAIALERQYLAESQQNIQLETEKEKMRANLLRAVSHDLRTPLTGMIGASETIIKNKEQLSQKEQDKLIKYIYEDSNWLLHMVENLLSVTRIKEGVSAVNKQPELVEEVVTAAVSRLRKRYSKANISVKIPAEPLFVPMDATLIMQVLINLLENGVKYAGKSALISLNVSAAKREVIFQVADNGKGLVLADTDSIFEGISPTPSQTNDSVKGIGIGLSICKTIINAHGGTISAQNQPKGGALFTFTLPLEGGYTFE
ncbi:ATP-binding protein [Anaerocolumna sp. AGMB13020]|uniref:ATP-binding protein n=1 Tax=Anaerocolumna sp. AGMB13020 TaxID=3081750 RepID=UPI002953648E|nr:ATP-binding protein [Anaerocolumna sp. AGMB13020]WOO35223.1 ATP-binding protein [Anaerocolumna sp. AGMB13020]